jgi:molybdopterin-containing oxidoreductase family iron-sulfur binding subunit
MKTLPPPCPEPATGLKYWRSLDELAERPEFQRWVQREFPEGASEWSDPVSRRHFVKIMGASFLLAGVGLTGCRRPVEKILPFGKMPENYIHGVPKYYATAMPTRGGAIPLLVKSHEGRPTKIEGNPEHPDSNGSTDVFAQASILNLYDPDRAQQYKRSGFPITREEAVDFLGQLATRFTANNGQGLAFLMQRSTSPSRERLQGEIAKKLPNARWYVHEPVDGAVDQQAATIAFGKPVKPYYRLDQAKVVLSLDCDFIGSEENAHLLIRGFAQGRRTERPGDPMNRLYVVEASMTQTGANADHRLRVPSSALVQAAALFAEKLLGPQGADLLAAIKKAGSLDEKQAQWAAKCAEDLLKPENRGRTLVLAGQRQPLAVHLVAQAINAALGSVGTTVVYHEWPAAQVEGIVELARALNAGSVDTLVILGGNPVYDAPADLRWREAQGKAKTVVRLGAYEDETGALSAYHLPAAHYLESWGDARTSDGTVVPVQPLIAPLFDGITQLEVLARLGGLNQANPYEIVRDTLRGLISGANFEEAWKKFLHGGYLANSAAKPAPVQFDFAAAAKAVNVSPPVAPTKASLEVVFHRDYKVDDGRYNNNGWLQELPDPITKMTWENVILLSPQTAKDLGLEIRDKEDNRLRVPVVRIEVGNEAIEGPAWAQPGMADHVVGLALGYGRTQTGRVGRGSGYNAYALRTSDHPGFLAGAKLTNTGRRHPLSTTQNHWAMEGRPIVREANHKQYQEHPDFAKGMSLPMPAEPRDAQGRPLPLYPNPLERIKPTGLHQWGMVIDLSACVGCSACMVACQSENNVPIVGKPMVGIGREMHWLRIDRYYAGDVAEPQVVNQPMLCQHCEAAPCENVCPVNATTHDQEGLNVMVYNRCIGTRYCSNNCPYKVRRFNFFDYNRRPLDRLRRSPFDTFTDGKWELLRWWQNPDKGTKREDEWELMKLARNPDVTVRMRGVMEKCTFCLQRIEQAKIARKVKAGPSGDIRLSEKEATVPKTACQQACPAEAIVFGDVSDPESRVSKLKQQSRDYTVLEFLLTKPRLTYLARIRNPNPEMPDYREVPLAYEEWQEKQGGHGAAHGGGAGAQHGAGEKKGEN